METSIKNSAIYLELSNHRNKQILKYDAGEGVVPLIYREQQLSKSQEKINNF